MVTAGVYLLARSHAFLELAPAVMALTAVIGTVTLVMAGVSALVQTDIKRVLAYSTMSQIGYMFLALGVGAFGAAIFHLGTHACFKALLFLCAGVMIQATGNEHDIFKMGGLRHAMPRLFAAFVIGSASLSAVPVLTAGFYSKDLILIESWVSVQGSQLLWLGGLAGAFLTALYSFRVVFTAFFGEIKTPPLLRPELKGKMIGVPIAVFSFLSLVAGFVETPGYLGGIKAFTGYMAGSLPLPENMSVSLLTMLFLNVDTFLVPLAGIYAAYILYRKSPAYADRIAASPFGTAMQRFFLAGWGFDFIYGAVFAERFRRLASANRKDFLDAAFTGPARLASVLFRALSFFQAGKLRWYAAGIVLGTFILLAMAVGL